MPSLRARAGAVSLCLLPAAAGPAAAQTAFVESAAASGIEMTFTPSPAFFPGLSIMAGGGAVGDFDRDGRPDLFILGGGGVADRLYLNQGGTFVNRAAEWGVAHAHLGGGVAVGDFDGDGWLDLFVTSYGPAAGPIGTGHHRLYRNLSASGTPGFEQVAAARGVASSDTVPQAFGAAFGDHDLDGDLDLFVAGWFTNGAGGNRLYRNDGGFFTDVTAAAGIDAGGVHGFAPRFVDMDGDRFPEILLVADFETSRYWRNDGDGTFTDITAASGTGLDCNGMGSAIGDFDRDGRPDWYVTAIFRGESVPEDPCGNMLYMNGGDHAFIETAAASGVNDGWWGWGAVAADLDHDGLEDLVAVNGYQDDSFNRAWGNRPSQIFRNLGTDPKGTVLFAEEAEASGFIHTGQGRGVARLDADGDGDQDIVVFATRAFGETTWPVTLYLNQPPADRHWLRVSLDTAANSRLAPDGFGSRVIATSATLGSQTRWVDGGDHYLSHSEPTAAFGLGPDALVDALRVEWASGQVTTLSDLAADQSLTITAPRAEDVTADGLVGFADLLATISAWGPCPACAADVNGNGVIEFGDVVSILAGWD
jgi:hypothetical protein